MTNKEITELKDLLTKTIINNEKFIARNPFELQSERDELVFMSGKARGMISACKAVLGKLDEPKPKGKEKPPKKQPKSNKFMKPTVEEVAAYCQERNNGVNAEQFIDHYEARGWILNNRQMMKCWKSAVRTWERMNFSSGSGKATYRKVEPIPNWIAKPNENQQPVNVQPSADDVAAVERINALKDQMKSQFGGAMK